MNERPRGLLAPAELARLANLQLVARRIVEGALCGLHRSPHHGFAVEFAEYREYVPGDDLRYFDWKAYGRSDRHYIKKYQSETNTSIRILIDRSASMGFATAGVSKLRWAACLGAAVAFVAERQQDAPGLTAFSAAGDSGLPPRGGPAHLQDLLRLLASLEPAGETRLGPALHAVAEKAGRRGMVVLLSDLWTEPGELLSGLRHLRFAGHDVLVIQVLDPAEVEFPYAELVDFQDLETSARLQVHAFAWRQGYLGELKGFLAEVRRASTEARVELLTARTDRPFHLFLARYLHRRARQGR